MNIGDINEKSIVDFLKQREHLLKEELKKIEATISVIESSNRVLSSRSSSVASEPVKHKPSTKRLKPLKEFNESGTLDEKISYAITALKHAYKEDILTILIKEQPNQDIIKLQNALGVRLSYLLKNELIAGEKDGRRYKYTLTS